MGQIIHAVLIDLDGTLLPLEQDEFIRTYFHALTRKVAPLGYEAQPFLDAMWKGTGAMLSNDGSQPNCGAFWAAFTAILGERALELEPVMQDFYQNEFNDVRRILGTAPDARALLARLRAAGCAVCLATNPVFPRVAVESRLGWIGLTMADFDLVTTYEASHYCKPDPRYYAEILQALGCTAENALMIGNNPVDDMSALEAGLAGGFLLTPYLENAHGADISAYPQGDFDALHAWLDGFAICAR